MLCSCLVFLHQIDILFSLSCLLDGLTGQADGILYIITVILVPPRILQRGLMTSSFRWQTVTGLDDLMQI